MRFLDYAKIYVESGAGGDGCSSFRREKYIEYGGPDGGNGGRGGDIVIKANPNINTLIDFRYQPHYRAASGEHGSSARCAGKSGADCVLEVPLGTQIWNEEETECLHDFIKPYETIVLLKGGRGGAGNAVFKSSINQAPREAIKGERSTKKTLILRLKLLGDIGLIGKPNAGKSSLLNLVTAARSKVGNYPFTTIHPHLGVLHDYDPPIVLVDLPGIIEGGAEGKGLGLLFLSHAERCRGFVHMIDGSVIDDAVRDYYVIRQEMKDFDEAMGAHLTTDPLYTKPECVVLNKADNMDDIEGAKQTFYHATGIMPLVASCALEEVAEILPAIRQLYQATLPKQTTESDELGRPSATTIEPETTSD